ncbi:twin transmembrane helix small protein [uncultured Sneathiella sp.]|jgi:threonine/homoserine/homoserine lactone efflux protein|uniref:twin transmembrane helix small protein n=1 Tax=uncultured Sneathiella sp. TaxID=879315 RepID=UPI0030DDC73B|tara:strand:- start:14898 stop:15092 length:195 start_codon:yes stop_codon:yes gene_type:complete
MINYLIVAAVIATALVLFFGVLTMARGGEFNRRYGNKLMQLRIFVQAVAVVLIMFGIWLAGTSS